MHMSPPCISTGGLKKRKIHVKYCIVWIVSPGLTFKKGVLSEGLSIRNTLYIGGLLSRGAYYREGAYYPDYTVHMYFVYSHVYYTCNISLRLLCKL